MKRPKKIAPARPSVIALALTWDGTRWPTRSLPPAARSFLKKGKPGALSPSHRQVGKLFARDAIREIRICWVPRLSGAPNVLSAHFRSLDQMRVGFRMKKRMPLGDLLGVIYQRKEN